VSLEKILIVDDEESILNQLRWGLAGEYEVLTAANMEEARRMMRDERPSIVTLDVTLGPPSAGPEGMDLLDEIVERHPLTKVIMVTGNDSRENAIASIRRGAVDWYAKPIELDELRVILRRAVHIRNLELAQPGGPAPRRRYHRLVGESDAMKKVYQLIQRVAGTDVNVLVLGENGTGKELVANAIHEAGPRREQPFVPINCGAIPETLLESELFGHERGSFTDAHRTKEGKFELADRGTLFLDEIGEVPLHLQVKLLRFLQDHKVERIGGRDPIRVDARVIAATNRDLKAMIADGRFREDLFYRLGVITIQVPPLRERGDDLRLLAEYFLEFYSRQHKRKLKGFTQAALRAILALPVAGQRARAGEPGAARGHPRRRCLSAPGGPGAGIRGRQRRAAADAAGGARRSRVAPARGRAHAQRRQRHARGARDRRQPADAPRPLARSTGSTRRAIAAGAWPRTRMSERCPEKREPRPVRPGGVSTKRGVLFSESRAAREVLRTRPPSCGGDEALDASDARERIEVRFFLRVRAPTRATERSIARLAAGEVREPLRFAGRNGKSVKTGIGSAST
jgi:two-component system NtrC family response regulator